MSTFTQRLVTELWAAHPGVLPLLAGRIEGAEHPVFAKTRQAMRPEPKFSRVNDQTVATLPIKGILLRSPTVEELAFGGVEDTDAVAQEFQKLVAEPGVDAIVLELDTPGGGVTGGLELAHAIRAARGAKPITAWTGGMAASLGYLIGSQAHLFLAAPSSEVGSIGTIATVVDPSKLYERLGLTVHTFTSQGADLKRMTPMNEDRSAHMQGRVDEAGAEFLALVLEKRPHIPADAMRGQTFSGKRAEQIGLINGTGTLQDAITVAAMGAANLK